MTSQTPFAAVLQAIPGYFGVHLEEQPRYEVIEREGDVEVRRYAPAVLCEVTLDVPHDEALDRGFALLAAYLFGESVERRAGSATPAPATAARRRRSGIMPITPLVPESFVEGGWRVAFFLGNDLRLEEVPVPKDARVRLRIEPARLIAAKPHSRTDDARTRLTSRDELLVWLEASDRWCRATHVTATLHDAPFVVPFLKRHEIHVAVAPRAPALRETWGDGWDRDGVPESA